jgi:hypothetical protein
MNRRNEVEELRAEIARLQAVKRRALAIADERSKENVELRQQWNSSRYNCGSNINEAAGGTR